ncbi:hypothetical protein [Clostridium botulinum]|uniref:hypothetical protein n=1 Tax=Clostridium botulinum TaxID=1491 RepID=UPI001FA7F48D|nr:hypothetical protein [Clostridium botulinum]
MCSLLFLSVTLIHLTLSPEIPRFFNESPYSSLNSEDVNLSSFIIGLIIVSGIDVILSDLTIKLSSMQ